ncbi:hypothetical protein TIFTF001_015509 [Ficus carica]|uniref:glutathione transferase n=1 Tax=Ficus carica TaxID=3494 RepID=A0AA88A1C9_FICCA|nr:hypothetical protein TIFTF001_015509 [Ficus carica]
MSYQLKRRRISQFAQVLFLNFVRKTKEKEKGDEVKVIGGVKSRYCIRVQWALKLKGVEYEYIIEDLKNKSPILVKSNPVYKKVPVLLHNGKAISESLVILEYIDEVWKENPLLPQDPEERASARFWAKFCDENVISEVWEAFGAQGEQKKKAIESAQESLTLLERQVEGKKFFGGEKLGYLDLVVAWIPYWLSAIEEIGEMKLLEAEKFPSIHKWTRNFMDIALINQCLPAREKVLKYFHGCLRSYVA